MKLGWLGGGNDKALADRIAAKKKTKTLKQRSRDAREADRAGQAWEARDRHRFR
ncbi:hypothetical protein [Streptomyces niveus]|uniref:hypothetical protein n=1 Tax=Streptomyces niveus TaxID=193462 RepID=UPI0036D41875